ncbi:ABC transporter substrate-binding protein [Desulfonatronospira sp.]|uniref:ABC transporter substrate-binding protein n=1 Tax=Desulfonatronospira sp. TaxID=1962951 RepID=UPI0025B9024F|nr:ABC transporter substrate-binding protein [Desulfonatronospira sp.]
MRKIVLSSMVILSFVLSLTFSSSAMAKNEVRFVYVPWTCVTIKTEVAEFILGNLGYETSSMMLSVPIAYQGMASGDADVFLGNWMPTMKSIAEPHFASGKVKQLNPVMENCRYTLAVPTYAYNAGLQHFQDIAGFKDILDYRIYGIEEGNDGNEVIEKMINENMFGLGDFELIPSSESGMLSQVQNFARNEEWIVFLGWSPHWMNNIIDMQYLKGSDERTFGENDGTATVYINIRSEFDQEQPNVARFLDNLVVPIDMINEAMTMLHEDNTLGDLDAGLAWLKNNPEVYRGWLDGVTTIDNKPALPVVEAAMAR